MHCTKNLCLCSHTNDFDVGHHSTLSSTKVETLGSEPVQSGPSRRASSKCSINDLGLSDLEDGCGKGSFDSLSNATITHILGFVSADDCGRVACSSRRFGATVRAMSQTEELG